MFEHKKKGSRFSLFISICLIVLLLFPASVFAEGVEPPAAEEETAVETTETVEEPSGAEEAPVEEATSEETEEPAEEASVEGEVVEAVEEEAAEGEAVDEAAAGAEEELAEIVEDLSEAEIVIVNEAGEALPLASYEAVEVLLAPDPIGCPAGVTPSWMGGTGVGCTANYTTIQAAIDDANVIDGWTVYVQSGTYNENVMLYKSISLIGQDKSTTLIQPASGPGIYVRADDTLIKNFTIDTSSWGLDFDGGSGYLPSAVTGGIENTTVENVDLVNNSLEGIYIGNGAQVDGLTVINSKLNDNLNGIGISGSGTSADNIVITNSEMNSNNNHGIQIQSNAQVESIEIYDSKMNSNTLQGVMVQTGAYVNSLNIYNSKISNNLGAGLAVNAATVNELNILSTHLDGNDDHGMYLYNATISSLYASGTDFENTTKWQGVHIENSNINGASFYWGSISSNGGAGLFTKNSTIGVLDIYENFIGNNSQTGLMLTGQINGLLWIDNNYFVGNGWEDIDLGYYVWAGGPLTVNGSTHIYGNNEFAGGAWCAIWVHSTSSFANTPIINYNWIDGPAYAIFNSGGIPIDAEYNYWGCDGGVGTADCKTVVGATNIDTDPWIRDPDADSIFSTNDGTKGLGWDGYIGLYDNCPSVYNPSQIDTDGDGIGDACDTCPFDAANDADADGVCGDVDNCPGVANAGQEDADSDGIGDVCDTCPLDSENDGDADGICGDVDNCRYVYNPSQRDNDGDGLGNECDPTPDGPPPEVYPFSGLIPVTGGELITLSCYYSNTLELPNGDAVIFNQVMCGYVASLDPVPGESLPGELPDGSTFAAGLSLTLLQDGVVVETLEDGTLTISFPIPEGMEDAEFSIMYWDAEAGTWEEISVVTVADGIVTATVDFPGTFVLVTK